MRHRVRGRKLGRTTSHRTAMFRNQLTALFTHERIITTLAKAKELRPLAERMVTLAGTGSLPARRKVLTMVPDKEIVRRLFDEVAPRFTDRPGGAEHEEGGSSSKDKTSLMDRAKGLFGGGAKAEAEETKDETAAAGETAEAIEESAPAEDEVEDVFEAAAEPEPVEEAVTVEEVVEVAEASEPVEAEAIDEAKAEETQAPVDDSAEEPDAAEAAEEPEAVEATEVEEEKKDS